MGVVPNTYTIGGVSVEFPFKPYPSQISMMNHIIKALNEKNHSLLESPTGSGKTLSLLCSTLSWQKNDSLKHKNIENKNKNDNIKDVTDMDATNNNENGHTKENNDPLKAVQDSKNSNVNNNHHYEPPQIFYCTRTHKQLSQVVSELKNTSYASNSSLKMTILSSREHSCINSKVLNRSKKNGDLTEACQELIKNSRNSENTCSYYRNMDKIASHKNLRKHNLSLAFDIEEYVALGKKCKACPFFASKQLVDTSNLILCPYNYIIDPLIRSSLDMNVKGAIVIIDEAHNIEDVCRSSLSYTFTEQQIINCMEDLNKLCEIYTNELSIKKIYQGLYGFIGGIKHWLSAYCARAQSISFTTDRYVVKGHETVESLIQYAGINHHILNLLDKYLMELKTFKDEQIEIGQSYGNNSQDFYIPEMSDKTKQLIQSCCLIFMNLLKGENYNDYVITLSKERSNTIEDSFDRSYKQRSHMKLNNMNEISQIQITCSFICLNPALAFTMLADQVHSVLLASGTLSPMSSFGPELGVQFKTIFESNHSTTKDQVLVAGLGVGPKNSPMKLTFQYYNMLDIQDQVGCVVFDVCSIVPKGVLCFVPSFNILEILVKRWKNTNLWQQLNTIKHVFAEVRGSNNQDSIKLMSEYTDCSLGKYDNSQKHGAIMFAVCRGKSSEGIDFSDDMARAVITIGIPFPNIKTTEISEKMVYNDERCKKSSELYLDGREWYTIQAYRAINQAIGRCIRHSEDWGAIILLDARFSEFSNQRNSSIGNLSRWVRDRLIPFQDYTNFIYQLKQFVLKKLDQTLLTTESNTSSTTNTFFTDNDEDDFEQNSHYNRKRKIFEKKEESFSDYNADGSLSPIILSNCLDSTVIDSKIKQKDKDISIKEELLTNDHTKEESVEDYKTIVLCHECNNSIVIKSNRITYYNDTCSSCSLADFLKLHYSKFIIVPECDVNGSIRYIDSTREYPFSSASDMFNAIYCQKSKIIHIPMKCSKCNSDEVTCWSTVSVDGKEPLKVWYASL